MAQRVTIKSIAQDLGISHMTVSRALSNHPSVREETRKAILERAEALGYVRNAAASAMRGEPTGIVGLLLPNIVNEFYARFANALALECEDRGLHLITHLTNDDLDRESVSLLRLRELQADAVVMVPAPGEASPETRRYLAGVNVVQLIRHRDGMPDAAQILLEDAAPIADAVGHLARAGHRRIGYVGAHAELSSGSERLQAFSGAMKANGLVPSSDLIVTAPPSFALGQSGLATLLDTAEPATALVCGGFEISNGALETALRRDLTFPRDLAFVGYGDPAFYEWIQGGITTISLPVEELAGCAAALVPAGPSAASRREMFAARLILRRSAGGWPS